MTPSKHIIHLFFPPLGREMVIVVNISLPSHPRSLRACTALGVGIKGSGYSRDILGCPGPVKDISPLPIGKSPHSSRTRGIQAFTTPNQTLSAQPPLPHFGLKSYNSHVAFGSRSTAVWPKDFPAPSLSSGQDCLFTWGAAPHFHHSLMEFGQNKEQPTPWSKGGGTQLCSWNNAITSSPACREPRETRATAQRFCLPSPGCSRQRKAPNATAS